MINKIFLAQCQNRSIGPKENQSSGGPDDWFNNKILSSFDIEGYTFDFFIDWTKNEVTQEVWFKLPYEEVAGINGDEFKKRIIEDIEEYWTTTYFKNMFEFLEKINMKFYFILFDDNQNWGNSNSFIYKVQLNKKHGKLSIRFKKFTISDFKDEIRMLSGGPTLMGQKRLIYGTSKLECYLSTTNDLYPGDADLILTDSQQFPIVLIEFKKHTKTTPMEEQKISNYYPRPDGKKYNRLNFLQNYIIDQGYDIPFFVLYYPTDKKHDKWKLESIKFNGENFTVLNDELFELPVLNNIDTYNKVIKTVLSKINEWK